MLINITLQLLLIFSIVSFIFPLSKHVCRCPHLIKRTFIDDSECGKCATCYWDLWYFTSLIQEHDAEAKANIDTFFNKFKYCSSRIPILRTLKDDEHCKKFHVECHCVTNVIHRAQCEKLWPDLPKPRKVSKEVLQEYTKAVSEHDSSIPTPIFQEGVREFFNYKVTCPSLLRQYYFTWYLLYDGAYKKYNIALGEDGVKKWDEEMSYGETGKYMTWPALNASKDEALRAFRKFGIPEKAIYKQKFCGHSDIFVCVEDEEGKETHPMEFSKETIQEAACKDEESEEQNELDH